MATWRSLRGSLAFLYCLPLLFTTTFAQGNDDQIVRAVTERDSLFWQAYNSCDTMAFRGYFTDDVEFFHDKGGVTRGIDAVVSSLKRNLCSGDSQMRRDVVNGSVRVFPLRNGDVPYGAIMMGEHIFSLLRNGKVARVDALARFIHLWMLDGGSWKMSRILSYDHEPGPYQNKRKEINLPVTALDRCVGRYRGRASGEVVVKREDGSLILVTKGKGFPVYPATETLFFSKDRDLTFEFLDMQTMDARIVIRENSSIVDTLGVAK